MTAASKLTLSVEEQQLVNNPGWILTKRTIIDKVTMLFGLISEEQKRIITGEANGLLAELPASTPKISKGENYLGLPYVMLDYPRCFEQDNIFAIRTMFWWGNFFSLTLLVSGSFKKIFEQQIIKNLKNWNVETYLCISESPWHHHFEIDNYLPTNMMNSEALKARIDKQDFLKLALRLPLHQWNDAELILNKYYKEMIELLKD